jgi:hypothetical protein
MNFLVGLAVLAMMAMANCIERTQYSTGEPLMPATPTPKKFSSPMLISPVQGSMMFR